MITMVTLRFKRILSYPFLTTALYMRTENYLSLNKVDVRTVFRSESKLNRFIKLGKDLCDVFDKTNEVFRVSSISGKCNVGETKRPLRIQKEENRKDINQKGKYHNGITDHFKDYEHDIENDFSNGLKSKLNTMKEFIITGHLLK